MVQNARWIYRIKKLEKEGDGNLSITPSGIAVGSTSEDGNSIKVTRMFYSILKADTLGFLLAIAAAIATAL